MSFLWRVFAVAGVVAGVALGGSATASAGCVEATGGAVVDCDGTQGESRSGTQGIPDDDGFQGAYAFGSTFAFPQYR